MKNSYAIDLLGLYSCDDGTVHITIATPNGWKCKRKGCRMDFKHRHTTYTSLTNARK